VAPICEGATKLPVAEVIIPDELGDFGLPGNSYRGVWEGLKADRHFRACSGCDAFRCRRSQMFGSLGWRCEGGFFYAGVLPFGHEAWEIFGIGEEGEDELNGVGKPLFGLKCVAHAGFVIAC